MHIAYNHASTIRLIELLKKKYFTFINNKQIQKLTTKIRTCECCQQLDYFQQKKLYSEIKAEFFNHKIIYDLVGPLKTTPNNQIKYVLTIVDIFSRYSRVVPLYSKNANEVYQALVYN